MKTKFFYAIKILIYICVFALLYIVFISFFDSFYKGNGVKIELSGGNMGQIPIEIFYNNSKGEDFSQDKSQHITYDGVTQNYSFKGIVPLNTRKIYDLRVDFGRADGGEITVKDLVYMDADGYFEPSEEEYRSAVMNDIEFVGVNEDGILLKVIGEDPYIVFGNVPVVPYKNFDKLGAAAAALAACMFLNRYVRIKSIYAHLSDFYTNRRLIVTLAVNDFKTKYTGSYFGIVWAFV